MADTKQALALVDLLKTKERAQSDSNFQFVGLKMEKAQAAQLEQLLGIEANSGGSDIFRQMLRVVIEAKS